MQQSVRATRRIDWFLVAVSYFCFVVLAMPGAVIGIAWPYIQANFELPLDAVGLLFLSTSIAYFAGSFFSGRLLAHFGIGTMLIASALITAVGLVGYVIAPSWIIIVLFGLPVGFGGGVLDAGMNIYFAANYDSRLMNWLHASFGVGFIVGPLLITALLKAGSPWQTTYIAMVVLNVILALAFAYRKSSWAVNHAVEGELENAAARTSARSTLVLPIVWIGIAFFLAYAGLESSASNWSYKLFTTSRAVAEDTAGFWVSVYGASFTVGRILFGFIVNRFNSISLVRFCLAGVIVGAILFWWNPTTTMGFIGLLIYGFMLAPVFALVITQTQERLGPLHGPNAIGFQVAAASFGFGILPGLAGIIANQNGLEIIPPYLLVMCIVMMILFEVWLRQKDKRQDPIVLPE